MMHGFGMGAFSLLWLLVPILLIGGGAAIAAIMARDRRSRIGRRSHDEMGDRQYREVDDRGQAPGGSEQISDTDRLAPTIFRLAKQHRGVLTVSDIVVETGLSPRDAESALNGLVDGAHVTMEVTDRGQVRYEFPELMS